MNKNLGLTHVYYGMGKGKTTAALGLALRALGHGLRVVLVQFLKSTETGELQALAEFPKVTLLRGKACGKFVRDMTEAEQEATRACHDQNLAAACATDCDLLILDEVLDALTLGLLDEDALRTLLSEKRPGRELVLTGHAPIPWVFDYADYITEMKKEKHPYDTGVTAREGIEF